MASIPRIIVFEDSGWQRLLPLVYMRAVYQLICGMGDLLGRIRRRRPAGTPLDVWCRSGIADIVAEQTGAPANRLVQEPALLLNGRGLWSALPEVAPGDGAWVGVAGAHGEIACIAADAGLAARLTPETLLDEARLRAVLAGVPRRDVGAAVRLLAYPWELIHAHEHAFVEDWAETVTAPVRLGRVDAGSYLLSEDAIHIGAGTRVKPCVVIDAEDGPVWIGENVTIYPHVYIQGPAYIGDGCVVQAGAAVKEGTYLGPVCKVGGEIEASIIQGYSNKQHDGFLGHSYIGSWVNIAADCINSDLKNTYGTIRVPLNGYEVDTGEMFVGMLMGDHSKAGINVSFPTGAVIGFCSSIFAPQSPKFVPSFTWITNKTVERYDEQRGLAIARKVMARRKKVMTEAEERAFLSVTRQALAAERQYLSSPMVAE